MAIAIKTDQGTVPDFVAKAQSENLDSEQVDFEGVIRRFLEEEAR